MALNLRASVQTLYTLSLAAIFVLTTQAVAEEKDRGLRYLIQSAGNEETEGHDFITVKEMQGAVRYFHIDKTDYNTMFMLKMNLNKNEEYQQLSSLAQADVERTMRNIMIVEKAMAEHRQAEGMWCRFALSNNPVEELPMDSYFRPNPRFKDEKSRRAYHSFLRIYPNIAVKEKSPIGYCWDGDKKQNDSLIRNGYDPETLKKIE